MSAKLKACPAMFDHLCFLFPPVNFVRFEFSNSFSTVAVATPWSRGIMSIIGSAPLRFRLPRAADSVPREKRSPVLDPPRGDSWRGSFSALSFSFHESSP